MLETLVLVSAALFVLTVAFTVKYWRGPRPSWPVLVLWGLGNGVLTAWDAYIFYLAGGYSVFKLAPELESHSELMQSIESWNLQVACIGALVVGLFWWRFGRALAASPGLREPGDAHDAEA
jgi:hypothetical protein